LANTEDVEPLALVYGPKTDCYWVTIAADYAGATEKKSRLA